MRTILQCGALAMLLALGSFAQQPAQPRFQSRLQTVVDRSGTPSITNYQLELTMKRGQKTAVYKMTLNGGAVSTELMDRFAEQIEGSGPATITFNATLTPFGDRAGGEVTVFLGRSIRFRTKTQQQGTEKEVLNSKSVGLSTKVTLLPGKAVTIFEDEDEKISLKLTELDAPAEKR